MSTAMWNDDKWVSRTPFVTSLLIEGGAIGQIVRMWHVRSAAGQSLTSWIGVTLAVLLWQNFYRVKTPNEWAAIWTTRLAVALNAGIVASVIYFRYVA